MDLLYTKYHRNWVRQLNVPRTGRQKRSLPRSRVWEIYPISQSIANEPFSKIASNRGVNLACQQPVLERTSKLLRKTNAGGPSSLGERAYSAEDSLRINFRVTLNILRMPSSTKSLILRTGASNATCNASDVYNISRPRCNAVGSSRAFSRSSMCSRP